jgi:hypothetical protein
VQRAGGDRERHQVARRAALLGQQATSVHRALCAAIKVAHPNGAVAAGGPRGA